MYFLDNRNNIFKLSTYLSNANRIFYIIIVKLFCFSFALQTMCYAHYNLSVKAAPNVELGMWNVECRVASLRLYNWQRGKFILFEYISKNDCKNFLARSAKYNRILHGKIPIIPHSTFLIPHWAKPFIAN